jgi:flagellin
MSVALSLGIRTSLFALSDISTSAAISNKRLATGKRVNDVLDNPLNFFLAKGFDKNKADLLNQLDSQTIALNTVQKTVKTIESVTKLVEQVQALANQARSSSDVAARDTLGRQIATTLNQINEFTKDAGFSGKNLLKETPDSLDIVFNSETGTAQTKLTVTGVDITAYGATLGFGIAAQGLGLTANAAPDTDDVTYTPASGFTVDVAGDGRLDALINQTKVASANLQAAASTFAVNLSITQVRIDYSKASQKTLASTSDFLTIADINEEGASLAALQTRQQIAVQALSLANQADQGILRLF